MDFSDFLELDAQTVSNLIANHPRAPMGVGIPFNGTRRWYMATFQKSADDLYTQDYLDQVFNRLSEIVRMMFDDGVHTVYTPIMGRDLAERGNEYMQFGAQAVASVGSAPALSWYHTQQIDVACYGQTNLLPPNVQNTLATVRQTTQDSQARHFLRYGVFADRPTQDLIARVLHLHATLGAAPTETQLIADYFEGPVAPVGMWIGSDQPTVFDVPLVVHGSTALYFLQFPTLYLNRRSWRRLLYDYLFVRGDDEALHPDNITFEQHITGLGQRQDGYWVPSTT
jgi:hypothetical protein